MLAAALSLVRATNLHFHFDSNVKDINAVLEATVYDEDRDHRVEFLGKVAIPLLRVRSGQRRWYALKDRKLHARAKGNNPQILLELNVVWNEVLLSCDIQVTCASFKFDSLIEPGTSRHSNAGAQGEQVH